ncbi:MAG: PD-(D/E)XK nuclease family protein [Balneolaceae bacterium]|nr:PD-(D/E)XK nuclease family protein [Balneolaceae bacterium]
MSNKDSLNEIIPVETIQERDIDLLLLEEIKCNRKFTDWIILNTFKRSKEYNFIGAWHSLSQIRLGESDLAFKIKINNDEIIFLIENKVNASFQTDQAERYRRRGEQRKAKGECDKYFTLLVAPGKYITRNDDFDYYIEYEEIKEWFLQQTYLGERRTYKANVLKIAIEKLRRGYSPIVDTNTTNFWENYYEYAKLNFPHLNMRQPSPGIPVGSNFFMFFPKDIGLTEKDDMIHKGYGAVDLQLGGRRTEIIQLKEKYSNHLLEEMKIVKAGKSAAIRIEIDPIDVTQDFNSQIHIIEDAFNKADMLYKWAKQYLKK